MSTTDFSTLKMLFVGTGVSCAIPVIGHVGSGSPCCCDDAAQHFDSPNRRNNVSLMITLSKYEKGVNADVTVAETEESLHRVFRVLIDAGKTFRNAYLRVVAPRRVRYVNALLLTHGHADAMNNVEDLCDVHTATLAWAQGSPKPVALPSCVPLVPMFLTAPTLREVELVVKQETLSPAQTLADKTDVLPDQPATVWKGDNLRARLQPVILPEDRPAKIAIEGLPADFPLYSLPVEHGKNYISLGFVFGRGTCFRSAGGWGGVGAAARERSSCVVYISDVTVITETSYAFLLDLMKIDILVIDLLGEKGASSPAHTCWDDLWAIFHRLHPKKVFCVGMFCSVEHNEGNAEWKRDVENERRAVAEGLQQGKWSGEERAWKEHFLSTMESVELAYDGQEIELCL